MKAQEAKADLFVSGTKLTIQRSQTLRDGSQVTARLRRGEARERHDCRDALQKLFIKKLHSACLVNAVMHVRHRVLARTCLGL